MKKISITIDKNFLKVISILIILLLPNNLEKGLKNRKMKSSSIPKVSVFLPIYNKAAYLSRSISSIQNQTLKEVEIVAVNDCSTDDTLKVLKKLAKNDPRIKIVNNDRNHGLLYSRAMGMINSTGEYVLNLDPDDQLQGIHNLEILYKLAKSEDADMIVYLLGKYKPTETYRPNISEISKEIDPNISSYKSPKQNRGADYLITNKFSKREVIVKAYEMFASRIYSHKWNFHEDNIWCYIIFRVAKKKVFVDKVMYIYLLNKESLIIHSSSANSMEIRNRVYRDEMLYKLFGRSIWLGKYLISRVTGYYRFASYDDRDIRVRLIHNLYSFFKLFKQKKEAPDAIADYMSKLSFRKIIIFHKPNKVNLEKDLVFYTLFRFLGLFNKKRIVFIDANNGAKINEIGKFVFLVDIFVSIDDILYQPICDALRRYYPKNKIIFFAQNLQMSVINRKQVKPINSRSFFGLNSESYNIAQKYINLTNPINSTKLYYIPNFIENWANFFNYKLNMHKNNTILILFGNPINNIKFNESNIKNINSKIFIDITFQNIINETKILEDNYENITKIIKKHKLIITDNLYIMELSAIYSTSCILFNNNHSEEVNEIFKNLDYIKYIHDIKDLEKNIFELMITSSIDYNYTKLYNQYYEEVLREFR